MVGNTVNMSDGNRRILIVEDDYGLCGLILKLLTKAGYTAVGVQKGEDAIDYILRNPDFVLLIDHQLPDMTGQEIINRLAELSIKVPFVMMTGHGDERLAVEMMKLGAADYLVKDTGFTTILPNVFERLFKNIDIEKRLRYAEEALHVSEARFRNLVANVPGVIFQCNPNPERNMIYISKGIRKVVGYPKSYFIEDDAHAFASIIHPHDISFVISSIEKSIEKRTAYEITYRLIDENNSIKWVQENGQGVYDESGKAEYIDGVIIDITRIKHTEAALRESELELRRSENRLIELNQTKDKFFSIISHDLKGVFSIILGLTECMELKAKKKSTENFEKLSGALNTTARNAYSLLENLLYWAKVQTSQLEFQPDFISIGDDLESITEMYSPGINEKRIDFSISIQSDLVLYADSFMIQTVLRNLISNAMKFTPVDGKIILEIKQEEDFVQFSVADTGVGIPKEDIDNLFRIETSFSTQGTNNEPGSGLGLILCKEFIGKHNGRIWVESEEGKGSTFIFVIPIVHPDAKAS
jgi:PAS domain S-box-containing protein